MKILPTENARFVSLISEVRSCWLMTAISRFTSFKLSTSQVGNGHMLQFPRSVAVQHNIRAIWPEKAASLGHLCIPYGGLEDLSNDRRSQYVRKLCPLEFTGILMTFQTRVFEAMYKCSEILVTSDPRIA